MVSPTQVKHNLKEEEAERLSAEVKRRISELQLKILSGTLSNSELADVSSQLASVRQQLADILDSTLREQTSRRVRSEEEKRKQV